mmetsp:Transcript_1967/g.4334  ORF Transcript_1967/g.4334 Transcript_1967/m.4334 type:complete len:106 (+) Transcript_1967:546-863(+)
MPRRLGVVVEAAFPLARKAFQSKVNLWHPKRRPWQGRSSRPVNGQLLLPCRVFANRLLDPLSSTSASRQALATSSWRGVRSPPTTTQTWCAASGLVENKLTSHGD